VNKLSMALMALAFGGTIGIAYGAQSSGLDGAVLVASAETKEVQSSGAHPNEPGISGDPVSAEKPGKATGGAVQSAGPHPEEPGISGDPVSAEKPGKATGGPVKVVPGPDAERNPSPIKQ
jgi:hypothetical protein